MSLGSKARLQLCFTAPSWAQLQLHPKGFHPKQLKDWCGSESRFKQRCSQGLVCIQLIRRLVCSHCLTLFLLTVHFILWWPKCNLACKLRCSIDLRGNKLVTFQPSPCRRSAQCNLASCAEAFGTKSTAVQPTTLARLLAHPQLASNHIFSPLVTKNAVGQSFEAMKQFVVFTACNQELWLIADCDTRHPNVTDAYYKLCWPSLLTYSCARRLQLQPNLMR